jgi:hypothetical protein
VVNLPCDTHSALQRSHLSDSLLLVILFRQQIPTGSQRKRIRVCRLPHTRGRSEDLSADCEEDYKFRVTNCVGALYLPEFADNIQTDSAAPYEKQLHNLAFSVLQVIGDSGMFVAKMANEVLRRHLCDEFFANKGATHATSLRGLAR